MDITLQNLEIYGNQINYEQCVKNIQNDIFFSITNGKIQKDWQEPKTKSIKEMFMYNSEKAVKNALEASNMFGVLGTPSCIN